MSGGHNRVNIPADELQNAYSSDRQAVVKLAQAYGVSIQCVYANMHRSGIAVRKGGDATLGVQARENNPNWRGGETRRKDGYILEYRDGKQRFQHRLVAEAMLGRPLAKGEVVHHINSNKSDNRPENLEVLSSHADHMRHHCESEVMRERGRKGLVTRYALKARVQ